MIAPPAELGQWHLVGESGVLSWPSAEGGLVHSILFLSHVFEVDGAGRESDELS